MFIYSLIYIDPYYMLYSAVFYYTKIGALIITEIPHLRHTKTAPPLSYILATFTIYNISTCFKKNSFLFFKFC